ncbi:kinase-like domain-containing protein, partial [Bisporella sp. PMI_857]
YGLITILALAQRLHIDLLPLTWQAALDSLGEGGQSIVKQALVAIQSSLAFKRFKPSRSDDSVLRDASREMIMLSHPAVRNHPFVVALEGICWDIQSVQQIWPVLVFEKSHLGDLHTFMTHNKGHDLPLCDRIALCSDIGIALRDMSLASIIHGDIKPQNVLVFEKKDGSYVPKVADFGFSTRFRAEDDLIYIPESIPWNAPERTHRAFTPSSAVKMDIYSFGLLCLWILF